VCVCWDLEEGKGEKKTQKVIEMVLNDVSVISQMSSIWVGHWHLHISTSAQYSDQIVFTPNWHEKWHLFQIWGPYTQTCMLWEMDGRLAGQTWFNNNKKNKKKILQGKQNGHETKSVGIVVRCWGFIKISQFWLRLNGSQFHSHTRVKKSRQILSLWLNQKSNYILM